MDEGKVEVTFRYLDSGWKTKRCQLDETEVNAILEGSTVIVSKFEGWGGRKLHGVTLKLKDGRKCTLIERNEPSYEGSSVGWIDIDIDEEWE